MEYAEYEWMNRIEAKLDFLLNKLQEVEEAAKTEDKIKVNKDGK